MPDVAKPWTREDLLALPDDGNRYELLDGELLVTPSPIALHQRAVLGLYDRIRPYVRGHRHGWTALAPADLALEGGQYLQPDLFVTPLYLGREPLEWAEVGIPLLVVEVVSPSTAMNDRTRKRRRYQDSRVPEYWIVDLDARLIERWRPDDDRPEIVTDQLEWRPDPGLQPLALALPDYFKEVWGES